MTGLRIRRSAAVIGAVFTALAAANAMAYSAGDFIVRIGAARVMPNEDSGPVKIDGANATGTNVIEITNDTQAGLSATYMFSPNWGIELLASTEFQHNIRAKGELTAVVNDIGQVKHLPPTLTLQWYPLGASNSMWQPYVGAGVNYIWFTSENISNELRAAGASNLQVNNIWSPAAQVGLDLMLDPNWLLNVSAMYIDASTTAKFQWGPDNVRVAVDIKPWVYRFNIGYRF